MKTLTEAQRYRLRIGSLLVAYAKQLGLTHQYLGYWVPGSASMDYKAQYRPHKILVRYPADTESPVWLEPTVDTSDSISI